MMPRFYPPNFDQYQLRCGTRGKFSFNAIYFSPSVSPNGDGGTSHWKIEISFIFMICPLIDEMFVSRAADIARSTTALFGSLVLNSLNTIATSGEGFQTLSCV